MFEWTKITIQLLLLPSDVKYEPTVILIIIILLDLCGYGRVKGCKIIKSGFFRVIPVKGNNFTKENVWRKLL